MRLSAGTPRAGPGMAAPLARCQSFVDQVLAGPAGPASLWLVALLLRLYQLGRSPFWLDELNTYRISLLPPLAIIQVAWHDPWPPLYYLIVKVSSGFGLVHAEWAWRILSVGAGTLAAIGMYRLLRQVAGGAPALLTGLLIALSPTLLYFSQEARAHIVLVLVAVASTAVIYRLSEEGSETAGRWPSWRIAWVGLTVVGLYLGYSYTLIWIVQAGYLLWIGRARWPIVVAVGLTGLAFLPLLFFIKANLSGQLASASQSAWLTWPFLARMLFGGDPNRYGYYWGQVVLATVLGSLALLGCVWVARNRADRFGVYLVLQTVLPLAGFFGLVDGLMKLHVASY